MTVTNFAHGVLPDDVIRDPSSQATILLLRLRADLPRAEAQSWLKELTALLKTLESPVGGVPVAVAAVGFGPTFFLTTAGAPRFGLTELPDGFARLPSLPGTPTNADVVIYLLSNAASVTADFLRGLAKTRGALLGVEIERGFQRLDSRELSGFMDGLRNAPPTERAAIVFVNADDSPQEPAWTEDGTYMSYLKIRQDLELLEALPDAERERRMGRRLQDGSRLDLPPQTAVSDEPDYTGAIPDPASHIRKAGPRGSDAANRFFRRGVPYVDVQPDGSILAGLQFVSFQSSLDTFTTVLQSWLLNPQFPPNAGVDLLFQDNLVVIERNGLFFIPPEDSRYVGAPIFEPLAPTPKEFGRLVLRKKIVNPAGDRVDADLGGIGFQVFRADNNSAVGPVFFTEPNGHAQSPDLPRALPLLLREVAPPANVVAPDDVAFTMTSRRQFREVANHQAQPGPYQR